MNEVVGDVKPALLTLLGAVGLCAFDRLRKHRRPFAGAVRGPQQRDRNTGRPGCGRARLVRQFFLEGLLLSLLGTTMGIALAKTRHGRDLEDHTVGYPALRSGATRFARTSRSPFFCHSSPVAVWPGPSVAGRETRSAVGNEQGGRTSGPGAGRPALPASLLIVFQVQYGGDVGDWRKVTNQELLGAYGKVDPGFKSDHVLSARVTLAPRYHEASKPMASTIN